MKERNKKLKNQVVELQNDLAVQIELLETEKSVAHQNRCLQTKLFKLTTLLHSDYVKFTSKNKKN
jgi:hypothetical protein